MADTALLTRLYQEKKYSSCADAARGLLAQQDVTTAEKATCYAYLCRSQFKLQEYGACIESGVLAAHLAEEIGDSRTFMQALHNVGAAQFHQGMLAEAVETYRRCLRAREKPNPSIDKVEGHALRSLGETLRALGRYEEAVEVLERARIWWQRVDPAEAERARSYAVWAYMEMGNTKGAERLLPLGDEYVARCPEDHYSVLSHRCDKARYHLLTGNLAEAVALAWECLGDCKEYPWVEHYAHMIIAEAWERRGNLEAAIGFAFFALNAADRAVRPDLFGAADAMLDRLEIRHPDAWKRFWKAYFKQRGSRRDDAKKEAHG